MVSSRVQGPRLVLHPPLLPPAVWLIAGAPPPALHARIAGLCRASWCVAGLWSLLHCSCGLLSLVHWLCGHARQHGLPGVRVAARGWHRATHNAGSLQMRAHIHTQMHAHSRVHAHTHRHTHRHARTRTCMFIHARTRTHAHRCVPTWLCLPAGLPDASTGGEGQACQTCPVSVPASARGVEGTATNSSSSWPSAFALAAASTPGAGSSQGGSSQGVESKVCGVAKGSVDPMCAHMHACAHVHVRTRMRITHIDACTHTHTRAHTRTHTHAHTHTHTHTCVNSHDMWRVQEEPHLPSTSSSASKKLPPRSVSVSHAVANGPRPQVCMCLCACEWVWECEHVCAVGCVPSFPHLHKRAGWGRGRRNGGWACFRGCPARVHPLEARAACLCFPLPWECAAPLPLIALACTSHVISAPQGAWPTTFITAPIPSSSPTGLILCSPCPTPCWTGGHVEPRAPEPTLCPATYVQVVCGAAQVRCASCVCACVCLGL